MKHLFLVSLFLLALQPDLVAQSTEAKFKIGDKAPDFTMKNQDGKPVNLYTELKKGPVILVFYRGQWCPYCNKYLSQLNDSLAFITAKKATVIAITPETTENVNLTVKKSGAKFNILTDEKLSVMKAYGVDFQVDSATVQKYKGYGVDFSKNNGDNGANLPVPATYLIMPDKTIGYVFHNPDYRKRAPLSSILRKL